jgi:hypothetical protein
MTGQALDAGAIDKAPERRLGRAELAALDQDADPGVADAEEPRRLAAGEHVAEPAVTHKQPLSL